MIKKVDDFLRLELEISERTLWIFFFVQLIETLKCLSSFLAAVYLTHINLMVSNWKYLHKNCSSLFGKCGAKKLLSELKKPRRQNTQNYPVGMLLIKHFHLQQTNEVSGRDTYNHLVTCVSQYSLIKSSKWETKLFTAIH